MPPLDLRKHPLLQLAHRIGAGRMTHNSSSTPSTCRVLALEVKASLPREPEDDERARKEGCIGRGR
jgi:hypothetical protein